MSQSSSEAVYGQRILSNTLFQLAESQPERLYVTLPVSSSLDDGFRDVTMADAAKAVRSLREWIVETAGSPASKFETIAYIGVPDVRGPLIFLAAMTLGYKTFFPSPRNAPDVNIALLKQLGVTKIFHSAEVKPLIVKFAEAIGGKGIQAPQMNDVFTLPEAKSDIPYLPSFSEIKNDPILVLHSSGSTGLPKPITMTHATFAVLDHERMLPITPGRENRDFSIWDFPGGGKFYTIFPYFHLAGFLSLVINPIFTESSSAVIGPALAPPSGALLRQVFQSQKLRALYIPPVIAEQLLQDPESEAYFKSLDFLCYTGGPFSPSAGEKLVKLTKLVPLYGCTEAFQVPQLVPSAENWAYMEWNPNFKVKMELAEDGAFELILFSDESTSQISAINHNLPGTAVFRSKDLFKPHPTEPNLWQYYGRRDDIMAFSSGEKYNPVPAELAIGSHPKLSGVLVVGQGRPRTALLLEPKPTTEDSPADLIEDVWPLVEQSNRNAASQGRITRSMVVVVPKAGFVRAGKGTVVRKLSEAKLLSLVEPLYAQAETPSNAQVVPKLVLKPVFPADSIFAFVKQILSASLSEEALDKDADLFTQGLDSVTAVEIIRNLKAGMVYAPQAQSLEWVNLDLLFRNSSISKLTQVLDQFLNHDVLPTASSKDEADPKSVAGKYISTLPTACVQQTPRSESGLTVALIGSTGSVGTSLLEQLQTKSEISHIYALNRRRDEQHEGKLSKNTTFDIVKTSEPRLGLSEKSHQELVNNVDVIFYNAWPVTFAAPLSAFDSQLQGIVNVIKIATESPNRPRIVFTSSISSVGDLTTGYAKSKWVAEAILNAAAEKLKLPVTILRVGQLVQAGDLTGDKDRSKKSWIPALVQASKHIGAYPSQVCDIDWLPVSTAATIIAELSLKNNAAQAYNIVHPHPAKWQTLMEVLRKEGKLSGEAVPLPQWVEKVRTAPGAETESANTLAEFFGGLGSGLSGSKHALESTLQESSTLASLPPLDEKVIESWLKN